jgi:hypothetical protein
MSSLRKTNNDPDDDHEADEGLESELQKKIVQWCRDNGYPAQSFPDSQKAITLLHPGWSDITILMYKRTLLLELKGKRTRTRKSQEKFQLQCKALGHEYHVVKSYKRFLEIVLKK